MRWPWLRGTEKREAGGDYSDTILRLAEAEAAGTAADHGATAAVESVAGALSRALAAATVGPDSVAPLVTREVLAQIGRDLIRHGESLHAIREAGGMMRLIPCASWNFEGSHDPASWTVRATAYGPSTSTTWHLPFSSVVFVRWGGDPGSPYRGSSPMRYASGTARLQAELERTLGDEAAGPIANIFSSPNSGVKELQEAKADITKARGRTVVVSSDVPHTWTQDRPASGVRRDWESSRLGPAPPPALVEVRRDAFAATVAACGATIALFDDSDGTAQREALRRWHLGTVRPIAAMIEAELGAKLMAPVRLAFDAYPTDLSVRAMSFQKLVNGGMSLKRAAAISGLMAMDHD